MLEAQAKAFWLAYFCTALLANFTLAAGLSADCLAAEESWMSEKCAVVLSTVPFFGAFGKTSEFGRVLGNRQRFAVFATISFMPLQSSQTMTFDIFRCIFHYSSNLYVKMMSVYKCINFCWSNPPSCQNRVTA